MITQRYYRQCKNVSNTICGHYQSYLPSGDQTYMAY